MKIELSDRELEFLATVCDKASRYPVGGAVRVQLEKMRDKLQALTTQTPEQQEGQDNATSE